MAPPGTIARLGAGVCARPGRSRDGRGPWSGRPRLLRRVHLQIERHDPHEADALRRRLVASANVQLCLDISGAFDILLLVVARDMDAYNDFAARVLEQPPVRRFETSFVKRRVKATLAVPLAG